VHNKSYKYIALQSLICNTNKLINYEINQLPEKVKPLGIFRPELSKLVLTDEKYSSVKY
jgi:hypothetical protein